jgi:hypothetical protein
LFLYPDSPECVEIGVLRTSSEEEVAETATFLASAKAGAIIGTCVNVTSGMFSS